MKICKNDIDIILYPVTRCSECILDTLKRPCFWLRVVGTHYSLDCGGVKTDILSDIFRL